MHTSTSPICQFLWNVCIPQIVRAWWFLGECQGGGAFQESSFAYVERDDVLKERRGISQIWEDFRDLRCKVKEEWDSSVPVSVRLCMSVPFHLSACLPVIYVFAPLCAGMLRQGCYVQHVRTSYCSLPAARHLFSGHMNHQTFRHRLLKHRCTLRADAGLSVSLLSQALFL